MLKESSVQIAKATLFAVVFSLVYVLVFTLIIQLAQLSSAVIKPVNQVFKIVAIALGSLLFIRGQKGYIKGAISGLCTVLVSYIVFSIIGGSFEIGWTFLLEILISVAAGTITGIIAVNLKKS
ncbi:MAG: TIGR04086 family membrane protein [Candidatus Coproplasma sp.]